MIKLINLTGQNSKIGTIVKQSPKRDNAFIYASVNETKPVFIVTQDGVKPLQPCNVESTGVVKVFVRGQANKGDIIRSRISGDINVNGAGFVTKSTDSNYVNIGTALSTGRNTLIEVNLNIYYSSQSEDKSLDVDHITSNTAHFGDDTNYTEFEADGTMEMNGDAVVWDDLRIIPSVWDVAGGTDPAVISYQPGGSGATFKVYAFATGDEGFFTLQFPHGYKVASNILAHVHWTPGTRGNEENGSVVHWALDYSMAAIDGTFPVSGTADLSDVCDGTDHKHQMTPQVSLSGTGQSISSQMLGRVYRSATADTWAGTLAAQLPIFLEIDFHIQFDTIGSRGHSTK